MFKRAQKKELGQALVEMAITAPILILILSGLLDLGRVYYTFIALEESAAEAALYLAIAPDCQAASSDPDGNTGNGLNVCADPNNALYRAETAGSDEFELDNADWNIPWDPSLVADGFTDPFTNCGGYKGIGCIVVVQVQYPFIFLTPGMERMADSVTNGEGLILTVQATQIIIFE